MNEASGQTRSGASPSACRELPASVEEHLRDHTRRVAEEWRGEVNIWRSAPLPPPAIDLSSNDYLRLGSHPEVIEAKIHGLRTWGNDSLMSSTFFRSDAVQLVLEGELAEQVRSEAVLLCQSGYAANLGLLQVLSDDGPPIYVDHSAHMSLWDGLALGQAAPHRFRHNDLGHLEKRILRHGPGVVVVDAVYSTDGSVCPLRELVELAARHGCTLLVDESHSFGTHGEHGEGLVAALGLEDAVAFRTLSLSKAMGERAGMIACPMRFCELFRARSHPAIFSSAVMSYQAAGMQQTLRLVRREGWRRERLRHNAARLRAGLGELGYDVSASDSQILSLEPGSEYQTIRLRDLLAERGVAAAPFLRPATARHRALVRFSVHCLLSDAEIDHVLEVCGQLRATVKPEQWPAARRRRRRTRSGAASLERSGRRGDAP